MKAIIIFNCVISVIFTMCYAYQFFYIFVGLLKKPMVFKEKKKHCFAVVISARNESGVIGNLIKSIQSQKYPRELVDVFVVADNCTDDTAQVARDAGAIVYERFNKEQVGKGYALDWMFNIIETKHSEKGYEGYIIFDADNILDPNYIAEMNKVFDNGYRIITSYRNSKNYDTNWITAGYSLWFLREARYLNNARMQLNTSCAVSGTGFLVSADVIRENNGWIHHLLTEDIEFTIENVTAGRRVGYCPEAVLYDEQPVRFRQSWAQRLRWSRGYLQVFRKYGGKLLTGMFRGSFSCYDMAMSIMPAAVLTGLSIVVNLGAAAVNVFHYHEWDVLAISALQTVMNLYLTLFVLGAVTTATEWRSIHCAAWKKIAYVFTFPVFMLTYVPIVVQSLFVTPEWTHIDHTRAVTVQQICATDYRDAV